MWINSSRVDVELSTTDARDFEVEGGVCRLLDGPGVEAATEEGVIPFVVFPFVKGTSLAPSTCPLVISLASGESWGASGFGCAAGASALRRETYLSTAGARCVMLSGVRYSMNSTKSANPTHLVPADPARG